MHSQVAALTWTCFLEHTGVVMSGPLDWVERPLSQSVSKLDKLDISKTVMNILCREDKLKWENNPYICRINELRVKQDKGRISSFSGWKWRIQNQLVTGTFSAHIPTVVAGAGSRADNGIIKISHSVLFFVMFVMNYFL